MYERIGQFGYPRPVRRAHVSLGDEPSEEYVRPHAGERAGPSTWQLPVVQRGVSGATIAILVLLGVAAAVPLGYFGWRWWKATEIPDPEEVEAP